MSIIIITRLGPLAALFLSAASLTANGQDRQSPDSIQAPVPTVERHRNPDYVAPDAKQPRNRRTAKRPEISGVYAVPFGPYQVSALAHYRASGIPFRISSDGKWLILSRQSGEGNNGEPLSGSHRFGRGCLTAPGRTIRFPSFGDTPYL